MPTIEILLPWPPSANSIWRNTGRRGGIVYRSAEYMAWIREAGVAWAQTKPRPIPILGAFSAEITLYPPDKRHSDIDNRVKVVLDFAQKIGMVSNDKFCRELRVVYGSSTPTTGGARLRLVPMSS